MSPAQNSAETPERHVVGRPFPKGVSGNPGGRPKGLARYVRELVGEDGKVVADFMHSVLTDESGRLELRIQAATWLADRGFGRPSQVIGGDEEAGPVQIIVRSIRREQP